MKKLLYILIIILLLPCFVNAEIFPKAGTAGLQFLKLGVDARAIGMGGAYTPISDDISAVYWNPAGVSISGKNQAFFSHTNWVADIYHEYFAISQNMSFGTLAFHASILHMSDMDVVTEDIFGPTGEKFTCGDISTGLTYSNMFTDKFSFGITGKYIREDLEDYTVNGFSVDLGTLYNTKWNNLTIGMSLRNFGPDLKFEVDNDNDGRTDEDPFDLLDNDGDGIIDEDREELEFKMPMNFSLGLSGDILRSDKQYLIGAFQLDNCVDREETWSAGLEYRYSTVAVRCGKYFNYDAHDYSFGLGFKIPTSFAIFQVDWAYTALGDLEESFIDSAHRVTLKIEY